MDAQHELEQQTGRTETTNPQTIWASLKTNMSKEIRSFAKTHIARINTRITQLQNDIKRTANVDASDEQRRHRIILEKELDHLIKKRYKNTHLRAQAQWSMKGETISKYWSKVNSPKKPRDIIHKLRDPSTNNITFKSSEMAEIAKKYHMNLQKAPLTTDDPPDRNECIYSTINEIPQSQTLNVLTDNDLRHLLTEQNLIDALYSSKMGSATGIDGIPYEAWKTLHEHHKKASAIDKPSFNVIKVLTTVVNDIQQHGVSHDTHFTLGWMCPLYKKKDHLNIENYRPITLLNTDYNYSPKLLPHNWQHLPCP